MSTPATPSEGSPSIVTRRVGAGIQARLAKLQGAAGTPVITRELPKKFPTGYDDPFKERLDGTLRRSLSGTWSAVEGDMSAASTDGSHTLVDVQANPVLPPANGEAELKRRQDFTKNWEKEQQAVANQLLSPEPPRIQLSPQPIIEEPEPEEEPAIKPPAPLAPEQKEPQHGILTPPISEPESKPAPKPRKSEPKSVPRPQTTPVKRVKPQPAAVTATQASTSTLPPPRTPPRLRSRASAPPATTLTPPVARPHLLPSPARTIVSSPLAPPRPHTSMAARRASAPERRVYSSKVPEKVLPPPVRPRAISKVYEGPTASSLAKQRPSIGSLGAASRSLSRTSCW